MSSPAVERASNLDRDVGKAVRTLRTRHNQKLKELAENSKVSVAMISRIENGLISPSLNTLEALADALEVPVAAFFQETIKTFDINVVRAGSGISAKRVAASHIHDFQIYCQHKSNFLELEVSDVTVPKDKNGTHPMYILDGFVVLRILMGECIYLVSEQQMSLSAGDILSFNASLKHGMKEVLSDEVTFMSIFTKPV